VTSVQYLHPVGRQSRTITWVEDLLAQAAVRILIVDDFEPWRRFLSSYLQQNLAWRIISEAVDGLEAIEKSRELQPDLILLDIGLPKLNGIEAARRIRKIAPGSKIIFFSENCCPDIVREALGAGGRGYVVKDDAVADLMAALESVIAGKQFVGRRFQDRDSSDLAGT